MTKTKEQLAFETWMETEGPKFNTDRYEGEASSEYYGIITELMWRAWEARSELKEQTVDVPNGYKLVPLVPTLAMCEASGFDVSESREAYKKMVLAVSGNNQVSLQSNEHTPEKHLFDPDAYLHVCRKKPLWRELSFNKDEPDLRNRGYKAEKLYTFDRVKEIVNKTKEDTLNACITFAIHGDADFFGLPEGLVNYFKRVVEPNVQNPL